MNSEFFQRFHAVWVRKRRVQGGQVVAATLLLGVLGFGLLALVDYLFELSYLARLIGLICVSVLVVFSGARWLWQSIQTWSQPATAAEIEQTFPTLGQAVRTTVQFSGLRPEQVQSAGVVATLVSALAEQTDVQTKPLSLEAVVPQRRLWMVIGGTAAVALLLTFAAGMNWEWRTASRRAALGDQPYRALLVEPGNCVVDEGNSTQVAVSLVGRTNRDVTFYTRGVDQPQAEWSEQSLDKNEAQKAGESKDPESESHRPRVDLVAHLKRLTKPIEYRVVAGELESEVYRISIRSPLKIQQVKVDLTPPTYTGQPTSTAVDANLSVLQGTQARFFITFDKPVKSASLVFAPRKTTGDSEEQVQPETLPLDFSPTANSPQDPYDLNCGTVSLVGTALFTVNESHVYSIAAAANDGTKLADNKFRIRVREDQPPQVFFESPSDSVEVHTLAELPMRIRVRDDYGLTKAGVIFQVNNEQEVPLIAEDFATVAKAADEVEKTGKVSPATQAALERILPLEHFELTQKDSVMYFAFAEDNLPDRPQRTETDMRFIDIRPFKREYRVFDPDPMNGMRGGIALKSLEELIQRQRFALNRTIQIEKRAAVGHKPDANSLDQMMKFETDLAQSVRDTALGLESRGFDDTELFYQAEAAMLQAVDSLSVGKWSNATLQMRDALKFLIEQRDRSIQAIFKNPDPARLAALRAFDRQQAQKLRRPKTDKEEARELIRRLDGLIGQEKEVATALERPGALDESGSPNLPSDSPKSEKATPEATPESKAEDLETSAGQENSSKTGK